MYWDGGPKAIKAFLDHHLEMCDTNYICHALDIKGMEFDVAAPTTPKQQYHVMDDEDTYGRSRSLSITKSPDRKRQRRTPTGRMSRSPSAGALRRPALRHGTSPQLFTVEDVLRLNDVSRVSDSVTA